MGTDGQLLGKWRLGNNPSLLSMYDWEDIAVQPGSNGPGILWMGDIGDNTARETKGREGRKNIKVMRAIEPTVIDNGGTVPGTLGDITVFEFTYPERPYDAEALTIDPVTGDLYFFTKVLGEKALVFVARAPVKSGQLEEIGTIDMPWITAADFTADGGELIVRNYLFAFHWERAESQSWREVIAGEPTPVPLILERQGESIGFVHDASGFFTISEGRSVPIYFYERNCQSNENYDVEPNQL
ncbi:MAG: hypothetical protein JXR76_03605 [Deltaproteobacteria bacterium]|nr:hypothetical protein [Deltaproteobacteria bacterium]